MQRGCSAVFFEIFCGALQGVDRTLAVRAQYSKSVPATSLPILTYSYESWVMTERVRSQSQASEISFLRRIKGVTLFDKMRSFEIRKSQNIESLLLGIERYQFRWFGHVSWMLPESLFKQALLAKANEKKLVGRPRTIDGSITLRILDGIAWDFISKRNNKELLLLCFIFV